MAIIIDMFRSTGENAGAKKCLSEFSTPMDRAVREMKNMYGNIILLSATESSNVSLSKPYAKSFTM